MHDFGTKPAEPAFEPSNQSLKLEAVTKMPVPVGYPCKRCQGRGWMPKVDQGDCPQCYGDDPYGQASYCAECEYCCGC